MNDCIMQVNQILSIKVNMAMKGFYKIKNDNVFDFKDYKRYDFHRQHFKLHLLLNKL